MNFCSKCGKEVHEDAVICVHCGCSIAPMGAQGTQVEAKSNSLVETITQRIRINAIIWIVIASLQLLIGLFSWEWLVLLIVGGLNLYSALDDLKYCKSFPEKPVGIVNKVKPLTGDIITLIYNLVFGGIIGVAGSIYYLIAVRGYVMENEKAFLALEEETFGVPFDDIAGATEGKVVIHGFNQKFLLGGTVKIFVNGNHYGDIKKGEKLEMNVSQNSTVTAQCGYAKCSYEAKLGRIQELQLVYERQSGSIQFQIVSLTAL